MTVLQAVSARFTGGKTPGVAFPSNTLAGSDLLGIGVFSGNNSSVMTQGLTSQNPSNAAWGTPIINVPFAGTGGLTLNIWRIPTAPVRVAHDPSSGATFTDAFTLDVGTFSTVYLIEQDADIEGVDVIATGNGTGTTINAGLTTLQYGDVLMSVLAHRNTDDQSISNPANVSWLPTSGAGNPAPLGAAANANAIHVGVTIEAASIASFFYNLSSIIGTSRNYVWAALAFKSFSGARPPFGTIGATTLWGAEAHPVLAGGNQASLVGVHRNYSWPQALVGVEAIPALITNLVSDDPTQTTVGLSFDVNIGGLPTTLLVDYTSATNPDGSPNWTLATQVTPPASPLLLNATVSEALTGLTANTTYFWRVEATNNQGSTISGDATFTTDAVETGPPVPVAVNATSISDTGATLVGTVNPENLTTNYYFEYGTSPSLATFTSTTDTVLAASDDTAHTVSAVLTGLTASTQYYFRVHAYNSAAPEASGGVDSSIATFTTIAASVGAPIPTTGTPTTSKATQLVVPGTVDPNGGATTWKAQASTNGFSTVAAETSAVALPDPTAGNVQSVSGTITGLTPNTAYTTRITATNSNSTVNATASGSITTEKLPTLSSPSSSAVTASSATIQVAVGHANMTPGAAWALVWGTSVAYGTTAGSGTVASSDADPTTVSASITGLSPSTTYHWRAQATRADGDGTLVVTADQTFTTSAAGALVTVTTPSAYGPASPISTSTTSGVPAYTIQVAADGTLHRSDTHAGITIAGNLFTGSGTVIIESDTAGTQRTPASGVLDQIIVQGPKLILRELIGVTSQGAFESNNSAAGVDFAIEFQGCSGDWTHGRAVACSAGAIRLTKSPSGLRCGSQGSTWPSWVGGSGLLPSGQSGPSGYMRIDNWTGQNITASTSCALQVDAARNVQIGGFDAGSQSTIPGPAAAPLATHAVRMDAALRAGGVKTDVQDVYITTATDATASMLSSKTGTYTFRTGTLKRSGIRAATFPNTLHQRPEKPIWFELTNGTQPGSETSGNCTNAGVLAEHFVLRSAIGSNLVTNTMRDGATMDQQYEVRCDIYDPADSLTLWTPAQIMDTWPNGNRYFIRADGVRRALGARPSTPAQNKDLSPLSNKSIIDETWTHMGGVTGDGVTEIIGVLIDPDSMQAGGTALVTTDVSKGAQIAVRTATSLSTTVPTTLPVQAPGGGTPVWTNWDDGTKGKKTVTGASSATPIVITTSAKHGYLTGDTARIASVAGNTAANGDWVVTVLTDTTFSLNGSTWVSGAYTSGGTSLRRADIYGVLTGYSDPSKPNEVATGVPYRRQIGYFGIDKVGHNLLDVLLIDGPSSTPAISLPPGEILKITAGVAESFHPHGLPTGESVTIATPALSGVFVVTRVDNFHFSINGQSAINWNPGPGTVGTFTPTTLHSYGLTSQQNPVTLPVGTTLDTTQNSNFGQGISNASIHIKAGSRVRFVRCTFNDISFVCDSSATLPEMVDCDGSVIGIPGGYDYDTLSTLGVPGKYDRFTQPLPARMQIANNWFAGQDCLWYHTRTVLTGAHGDVFPARFKTGSEQYECYIDQSSPAGTNNDSESNVRSGVGQNLPMLAHFTHGDICQWFARSTTQHFKCILAGQAHSVYFGTLGSWEQHTGCTLSNSGGSYLVTLPTGQKHNFDSTGFDTVLVSGAGPLNGIWNVIAAGLPNTTTTSQIILSGSVYPPSGAQTACTIDHYQQMVIPGCYRSTLTTIKHVESGDRTRLSPILAKGNLTSGIGLKVSPLNDGGHPAQPIVIAGLIEYRATFRDCCIDNGGAFNLPDPQGNPWIDLGTPNRNTFTAYSGTGIPGQAAVVHYTT